MSYPSINQVSAAADTLDTVALERLAGLVRDRWVAAEFVDLKYNREEALDVGFSQLYLERVTTEEGEELWNRNVAPAPEHDSQWLQEVDDTTGYLNTAFGGNMHARLP